MNPPVSRRIYVKMVIDFELSGAVTPRVIIWKDGRRFPIEKVLDVQKVYYITAGLRRLCYTVLIHGEKKLLYAEPVYNSPVQVIRWWVEKPNPAA